MPFNPTEAEFLSLEWRDFVNGYAPSTISTIDRLMLAVTDVANLRNVQLWHSSTQFRRIINRNTSADQYDLRRKIVRASLGLEEINGPQKTKTFNGDTDYLARKFALYMSEPYVRNSIKQIIFYDDALFLSYDTYSVDEGDDLNDDDFDEFGDVLV